VSSVVRFFVWRLLSEVRSQQKAGTVRKNGLKFLMSDWNGAEN
jgi:hypothetical protein